MGSDMHRDTGLSTNWAGKRPEAMRIQPAWVDQLPSTASVPEDTSTKHNVN